MISERQKYHALLDALYEQDLATAKSLLTDLFLDHLEPKIRKRAFELGYFFERGVTFENGEGVKEPMLRLVHE